MNFIKYEHVRPREVDPGELKEAEELLEELPLDRVPVPAPPSPISVVPPIDPNPLFVGREEDLKALAAKVKAVEGQSAGPVRTVAVTGLGGVGKTQLVGEFAHRYGRYFDGGVYWLNLSNSDAAGEQIAACGEAGAMRLRPDFDRLPLEGQVKEVMAAWQSVLPRLLVLDNCENGASLRACRPTTGGCRVLVTSRGPLGDPALGVIPWPLEVLSREESVELLRKHCKDMPVDEAELGAVAEELGDLPLALDLAGRFLARYRHAVSPGQYVEELRSPEVLNHRSLRQVEGFSPTGHEMDVGRTFVVSYERLDGDDPTDRLAMRLLARAARFAPGESIERGLLLSTVEASDGPEEGFDDVPADYQREDALRRLTELGLVGESEAGLVRMHRLVSSFARCEIDDREAQADVERAVANETLDVAREGHPVRLTGLLPHLRNVTEAAGDREDEPAYVARFALGSALSILGSYAEAVPLLDSVVRFNTARLGATTWKTMRQRNDLGVAMKGAGDLDGALKVYEEVLEDQERELGPRDPDVASTLNNIGALLRSKGRLDKVLPIYERALEIRTSALGWEHRDTAESLHNLGALLIDLDRHDEACPYLQRSLEIYEKALGQEHLDNVLPLSKLGLLLRREGNYAEARPFYERTLEICKRALGPEHHDVFERFSELGSLLAEQELYDEAQPYLEQALEISQKLHGEDHPDTAMSLNKLGSVLVKQGNYDRARLLLERELAICEKIMGKDDPQTARCLSDVATVLWYQRLYAEARPHLERAVRISEKALGETHLDTASALNNLASVLSAQNLHEEARPHYKRALTIRRHALGVDHLDTAISMNNLAGALMYLGSYAEAKPYQEQALAIFQSVLGEHSYTAMCLDQLGDSLRMQGLYREARPYLVRALVIGEKVFGREHPFTARVWENLRLLDS